MADPAEETDADTQDTGSEAEAMADILAWSQDCPEWQRDSLRRLCTNSTLDDADLDELTALCKTRGKGGTALAAEHVPDPEAAAAAVNLRAIHGGRECQRPETGRTTVLRQEGLDRRIRRQRVRKIRVRSDTEESMQGTNTPERGQNPAEYLRKEEWATASDYRLQRRWTQQEYRLDR